jgi:heme exporter protein D
MTFAEFIHMGGYAFYIWGSYALGLVVFAVLFISVKQQHNRLIKQLSRELKRKQAQSLHKTSTSSI